MTENQHWLRQISRMVKVQFLNLAIWVTKTPKWNVRKLSFNVLHSTIYIITLVLQKNRLSNNFYINGGANDCSTCLGGSSGSCYADKLDCSLPGLPWYSCGTGYDYAKATAEGCVTCSLFQEVCPTTCGWCTDMSKTSVTSTTTTSTSTTTTTENTSKITQLLLLLVVLCLNFWIRDQTVLILIC